MTDACRTLGTHLVLAVHRRDVEGFGVLGGMRVIGPGVDPEIAHLLATERATRDHPLDRLFEDALRELALEHLAGGDALDAAGIAGVAIIDLVGELAAGEADLL